MTDTELIKAVADRQGWTNIYTTDLPGNNIQWRGTPPEAKRVDIELPPWLTSVDAALGVLDTLGMEYRMGVLKNGSCWCEVYRKGVNYLWQDEPSLPRAILLAFLELPKEKP
ncbi:hypothetical protein LCGC14_2952800 [marine sediment metagenome]|uniref:Phage ABA sandwich domain-containing protein n=1 Tax=marine sediment metagenome TaxID=412755 RepID=A0A0F8XEG7_9ZZZZ